MTGKLAAWFLYAMLVFGSVALALAALLAAFAADGCGTGQGELAACEGGNRLGLLAGFWVFELVVLVVAAVRIGARARDRRTSWPPPAWGMLVLTLGAVGFAVLLSG